MYFLYVHMKANNTWGWAHALLQTKNTSRTLKWTKFNVNGWDFASAESWAREVIDGKASDIKSSQHESDNRDFYHHKKVDLTWLDPQVMGMGFWKHGGYPKSLLFTRRWIPGYPAFRQTHQFVSSAISPGRIIPFDYSWRSDLWDEPQTWGENWQKHPKKPGKTWQDHGFPVFFPR